MEFASSQSSPDYANAVISVSVAFNWADVLHGCVRPTTQLTDTQAMSTKNATTAMKRRHSQFWCLPQIPLFWVTVDFYRSRWASSDPDSEQTLRNKDQLVFEGLQSDDMRAQLTATEWTDVVFSNIKLPTTRKACKAIYILLLSLSFFFISLTIFLLF